jgi:hypothetical protein
LDTPDGGNYWGAVGRDPAWEKYLATPNPDPAQAPHPAGLRHSGAGFYTGVFVVLMALFAVFQAGRGQASALNPEQRRWVWFWGVAALISLLLALGRHAPFYQIVYAFPYFSTIRNPIKFLHPFSLAMVILCAYGLQAALVVAVERQRNTQGRWAWEAWWSRAVGFERKFTLGCGAVVLASVLGWVIYAASKSNLVQHLQRVGFGGLEDAERMAGHSVGEVGWFVLFLSLAIGWLTLARSGFFRGPKSVGLAAVLAGGVMVADLARANSPWVEYYNYQEKYASNPVIDRLRKGAHDRRVSGLFLGGGGPQAAQALQALQQVYGLEWLQHLFPYYSIQSVDIVQDPRPSADNQQYRSAFLAADQLQLLQRQIRQWELTSTRYFVALAGVEGLMNQQVDGGRGRFRLLEAFQLYQEIEGGPILVATNDVGPYGVIEFTGALPKTSLFSQWEVIDDSTKLLERLVDPEFDPVEMVLLEADPWPGSLPTTNVAGSGAVTYESYSPKHIELSVNAPAQSVLLLNDKYHPDWEVTLDGVPTEILRANFLMRGVAVPAGRHTVEFRYQPLVATWYVSLAAVLLGLGLCGRMLVRELRAVRVAA